MNPPNTPYVRSWTSPGKHASPTRIRFRAGKFRSAGAVKLVVRTAGFNAAATVTAGLGGVIIARTLGPTVRGQYAAITAWFGVMVVMGDMGQQSALCFYVSRQPRLASSYVATARTIMLSGGSLVAIICMAITPLIAHGNFAMLVGYRIAFGTLFLSFIGTSYVVSLQGRDIHRWNLVRLSQPGLSLFALVLFWRIHFLTLAVALEILAGTIVAQAFFAYISCRSLGMAPGHTRIRLVRPLATYGAAQIVASAPTVLNTQLDQLILSQAVPAASLGRYAVAVSLAALPFPLCSAIGNVAFPRLASKRDIDARSYRLQWLAILSSAGVATLILIPLSVGSIWLVPLVFGSGYRSAVPMIWVLAPGSIFIACGQVSGDLLRGRKEPMIVAKAQGIAVIATIIILVTLLPYMGVYAAAVASSVAYGISLFAMLLALRRPKAPQL
jgi:O-antigen/teichoic acid export membrane protein